MAQHSNPCSSPRNLERDGISIPFVRRTEKRRTMKTRRMEAVTVVTVRVAVTLAMAR